MERCVICICVRSMCFILYEHSHWHKTCNINVIYTETYTHIHIMKEWFKHIIYETCFVIPIKYTSCLP